MPDVFNVTIDNNLVYSINNVDWYPFEYGWSLVSVDLTPFADGNYHILSFNGYNPDSPDSYYADFFVDLVQLIAGVTTQPVTSLPMTSSPITSSHVTSSKITSGLATSAAVTSHARTSAANPVVTTSNSDNSGDNSGNNSGNNIEVTTSEAGSVSSSIMPSKLAIEVINVFIFPLLIFVIGI